MKFNTRTVLLDPMTRNPLPGPLTLGNMAALVLVTGDDKGEDLKERTRRFVLGCKIANALEAIDGTVEIATEDATLLKELVDKRYGNDVVAAQFAVLIDPPEDFVLEQRKPAAAALETNGATVDAPPVLQ